MGIIDTARFIMRHPLNRERKTAALIHWLRWQLGSRLLFGWPVAVPFANGASLLAKPGMTGATGNIYCGLHEFEDMAFVLHFLRPNDLFADIGANIGSYTILACTTGARCISFEPVPATYEKFLDNLNLNRSSEQVDARNEAVGQNAGWIEMITDQDTTNQALKSGEKYAGETERVPVTALDKVLQGKIPKLIKIDVECFETEVLAGANQTLMHPQLQAVIMELNGSGVRYGYDENALHLSMLEAGFRSCQYKPMERKIVDLHGNRPETGNTLYIRDLETARNTVKTASRQRVVGIDL